LNDAVAIVFVAVVVMPRHPQAILVAMITMRKSIHGFSLLSYMGMGLCLAALQAAGDPLLHVRHMFLILYLVFNCQKQKVQVGQVFT